MGQWVPSTMLRSSAAAGSAATAATLYGLCGRQERATVSKVHQSLLSLLLYSSVGEAVMVV